MHRRDFLQGIAATAAGLEVLSPGPGASAQTSASVARKPARKAAAVASLEGCTLVAEFKLKEDSWKVYEDLRTREGSLVFASSSGETRVLARSAEASMPEGNPYLGLALKQIGLSSPDLLADRLLQDGDPDPEKVKSAAPPMASAEKNPRTWTTVSYTHLRLPECCIECAKLVQRYRELFGSKQSSPQESHQAERLWGQYWWPNHQGEVVRFWHLFGIQTAWSRRRNQLAFDFGRAIRCLHLCRNRRKYAHREPLHACAKPRGQPDIESRHVRCIFRLPQFEWSHGHACPDWGS